ncbi:MAG TPA: hypothetical protein VG929_04040 [Actinomycetota bacterium]|nr:hypothetical protein [Actinomycetota bacterium]
MNPIVKKAVAVLAIKEGIERINEMRKPKKPSFAARFGKLGLIVGAAGGAFYAYKSGLFDSLLGRSKDRSYDTYQGYEGSMSVERPLVDEQGTTDHDPVGTPTV